MSEKLKISLKKACCILLCAALLCPAFLSMAAGESKAYDADKLSEYIETAFSARQKHTVGSGKMLSHDSFISEENGGASSASSTLTDWAAFSMARYGRVNADGTINFLFDEDYPVYLSALEKYVTRMYSQNGGVLSTVKATEWHRLIITVQALGGNPEAFGEYNGQKINLIADSTYNSLIPLSRQGINGMIFALISKNLSDYSIPQNVKYTDEYMISYMLSRQLTDGGWAVSANAGDPDITAMAIEALTPYYGSAYVYSGTNVITRRAFSLTAKAAVDSALEFLSAKQEANGGYSSWGTPNAESTAQVITALTGMGIDIFTDTRFIKNSNTLLDGLLIYRLPDGSFTHSYKTDPQNSAALQGSYNLMATDQASYALVALWRQQNGMCPLYNMRADNLSEPDGIFAVIKKIILAFLLFFKTAVQSGAGY